MVRRIAWRVTLVIFVTLLAPPIDPDGPCPVDGSGCLFETPIEDLQLPEDLGFIP